MKTAKVVIILTHLCLASHKRDIASVNQDQTPQNAVSDHDLHCFINKANFYKHCIYKKKPAVPFTGKGLAQRAMVEEHSVKMGIFLAKFLNKIAFCVT